MQLLELLGRRWAMRILWELRESPLTFRALQAACGDISPSVCNRRLRELADARLVELVASGYALTVLGGDLIASFDPLSAWTVRWARTLRRKPSRTVCIKSETSRQSAKGPLLRP